MSDLISKDEAVKAVDEAFRMGDCYCDQWYIRGAINDLCTKGKWLNLDVIISEQDEIIRNNNEDGKTKDPQAFLDFATARAIKVYLLKKYAEQEDDVVHGQWVLNKNGVEVCSVCWVSRKASELDGRCVMCGAYMSTEEE